MLYPAELRVRLEAGFSCSGRGMQETKCMRGETFFRSLILGALFRHGLHLGVGVVQIQPAMAGQVNHEFAPL